MSAATGMKVELASIGNMARVHAEEAPLRIEDAKLRASVFHHILDMGSEERKCAARKEFQELESDYHNTTTLARLKPNICQMMKQLKKENNLNVYIPDSNNDDNNAVQ